MAKVTSGQVGEYLKIGLYIAGAFVAYKAIKKITETFGLTKTEEEEQVEDATEDSAETSTEVIQSNPFLAFNPQYGKALAIAYNKKFAPKKFDNIKQNAGRKGEDYYKMCLTLRRAKGNYFTLYNDNEEAVYNVFRNLQTQFQLSQLSLFWSEYAKSDLLEYLKSFLNADELKPILDQVKNYPQYLK
jgi:hypothetical protein